MPEITMPRLSDTMEEGTMGRWLKQVGDTVERGEVIAEIESDKATMDFVTYEGGVLEQILVQVGETVPVGHPLAVVGSGDGAVAPPQAPEPAADGVVAAAVDVETTDSGPAAPVRNGEARRVKASPLARARARDLGIALDGIRGTGEDGRIVRADVEAADEAAGDATPRPPAPAPPASSGVATPAPAERPAPAAEQAGDEEIALSSMRRIAARRLTESMQQAPHFFLTRAVEVDALLALRGEINGSLEAMGEDLKVSVNDLLVRACAVALRANPAVNVSWAGDRILRHRHINIGVAVATDNGLIVPVVRDADHKTVTEISREVRVLIEKARAGKLSTDEFTGGTFTISNLGMYGIAHFTAVINPPEAALLAVGGASARPAVAGGEVVIRQVMALTLAIDHRPLDGAVGALFLQRLAAIVENPLQALV